MSPKILPIIGTLLLIAGVGIFSWLGYSFIVENNMAADSQAKTAATATLPHLPDKVDTSVEAFLPDGQVFARLYIPAWGDTWVRPIAEGTNSTILLNNVGHYSNTELPGQVGNFAVASHRTTYGANFLKLNELQEGDKIYVQTGAGIYEYTFRNSIITKPSNGNVLLSIPQGITGDISGVDKFLTMTTCDPIWSDTDRLIGFSVFTKFYENSNPPAIISQMLKNAELK